MGHVSPLLSIIFELKDQYEFVYFGLKNSIEEEICKRYNIDFYAMNLKPFDRKNILKNIKTFFLIFKETKLIKKKFKKEDTKAIISSGGFVSIPLFLALNSRKKILLESNTTLGLANRFLLIKASHLGVNFDTIKHKKKVVVGNPIKINEQIFDHLYFYLNEPIILFVGGSNGAFEIVKMAYEFNRKYPDIKAFVITGKRYKDTFEFGKNIKVFERIENLSSILNKFTLVISRAGASTITELLISNSVFLLVPSHNVSGNHQVLNANFLEKNDVCNVVYDIKDLGYLNIIYNLIFDAETRGKYRKNMRKITIKNSLERVISLIEK